LEERTLLASLTVALTSHTIAESAGVGAITATVTRADADLSQPLTVYLTTSDPTEASVPATVIIPANQASATFSVNGVEDNVPDGGSTSVTISGQAAFSVPIQLDSAFGNSGTVSQNDVTSAVALQPNGKIVTVGYRDTGSAPNYFDFVVSRYNPDGTPDVSFGGTGTVVTDLTGQKDIAEAVAIQSDGKIVVGGTVYNGPKYAFGLARYNSDGSLDAGFGQGGTVIDFQSANSYYNQILNLVIQPDGRILAGGNLDNESAGGINFAVVRYNTDGTRDTSFGSGGVATTNLGLGDRAYGLALQADGKVVLAGVSSEGNSISVFALTRYTTAGQLDATFGSGGVVITDLQGTYEEAHDLVIQPDGKIVVAGQVDSSGAFPPVNDFAVARYNADGSLDGGFGSSGTTVTDFGADDTTSGTALQPDGRIVVAGTTSNGTHAGIARYTPNGALEVSDFSTPSGTQASRVLVQADGKIILVGTYNNNFGFLERFTGAEIDSGSDTLTVTDNEGPQAPAFTSGTSALFSGGSAGTFTVTTAGNPVAAITESGALPTGVTFVDNHNGTATLSGTPAAGRGAIYSLTLTAANAVAPNAVQTFTLTVDHAPVANGDSYSLVEDTTLNVPATSVLANDTDADGDPLMPHLVGAPGHGSATLSSDGSITYTPAPNFIGTDGFSYRVNDGILNSNTATVTLTITQPNRAPVAANDAFTTNANQPLTVAPLVTSLYLNSQPGDYIGQGQTLGYTQATGQFSVSRNSDQGISISYQDAFNPAVYWYLDFAAPGNAVLTVGQYLNVQRYPFQATSQPGLSVYGEGRGCNTLTGNFTVTDVLYDSAGNVLHFAANFEQHCEGMTPALFGTIQYEAPGLQNSVLANDTDADGDPLTAALVSGPTHGSLAFHTDGTFTYTPAPNFAGTDSFTYKANDGQADSNVATVTLAVDQAPAFTSASATTFTAGAAGTFTVATSGFPTAAITESGALPSGLRFTDNGNSTATLSGTPAAGSGGVFALTFTANNGVTPNATQTFTLTIHQAPVFTSPNAATFTVGSASGLTVTTSGVPAVSTLTEAGKLPGGMTFVDNHNGTATLSGTRTTTGTYRLTFTASNGVLPNATQTFTLTVAAASGQAPAFTSANAATFTVGVAGSFTVATTGLPVATLTEAGKLPAGVTFVDNHNGTATLRGTPTGTGTYRLTFTASNGSAPNATQTFTLTTAAATGQAPAFNSGAAATFTVGTAGSFTITTTGSPAATLTQSGTLPGGVTFTNNGNGTATLSGTPAAGTGGTYTLTLTASNGIAPNSTQTFTLTVNSSGQAPAFTSANTATFTVGAAGTFTVTTTGNPVSSLTESGALPSGVTFTDNGTGSASLRGTPAAGTGGTYVLTLTASNGVVPNATQSFTLTVNQAPAFTSANHASFAVGAAGTFTITTTGFPFVNSLTESGALPSGVTFVNNRNGTATLRGTPAAGTAGTYTLTFTAINGVAPKAMQTFTLTVTGGGALLTADVAGSFNLLASGPPASAPTAQTAKEAGGVTSTARGAGNVRGPSGGDGLRSTGAILDLLFQSDRSFHALAGRNDDDGLDAQSLDGFFQRDDLVAVK
jgi:uncharacterized delta-60 repeat protein